MSDSTEGTAAGRADHRHAIQMDGMFIVSCISSQTGQAALALPAMVCDATSQPRCPGRMRPDGRP